MRILFDTNVLIHREDPKHLLEDLQGLLRVLEKNNYTLLTHPASREDIDKDKDEERRQILISKLGAYPELEQPPVPDKRFSAQFSDNTKNDEIDTQILFAVHRNAVDFLVTEDKGILKKARKVGIDERVFDIESARDYFEALHKKEPVSHLNMSEKPLHNLSVNDEIFDSLKEDYPDFEQWFSEKSKEGRKCWVYEKNDKIKAILIYKEENEPIELKKEILPKKRRLKICTLKVEEVGYKIGELLLKLAFQYCVRNDIDETYLTHFTEDEDLLVELIKEFGFEHVGKNKYQGSERYGEDVYIKSLLPPVELHDPLEMSKKYFPSFVDGPGVKKYLVPIIPQFHSRLFQGYTPRWGVLGDFSGMNRQGNTIKKAYLTHSKIQKIKPGDVLLFYRSRDQSKVTSLGVVEKIVTRLEDPDEVTKVIGKRAVYNNDEIVEMCEKEVTVILFRHHFNLKNPLELSELIKNTSLKAPPQSITTIGENIYKYIKEKSGVDERFAFN